MNSEEHEDSAENERQDAMAPVGSEQDQAVDQRQESRQRENKRHSKVRNAWRSMVAYFGRFDTWDRDDVEVFFSFVVALASVVGIVGLFVSSWLTLSSLRETRAATKVAERAANASQRSTETAVRQLEATDRPWIKVVSIRPRSFDFLDNHNPNHAGDIATLNVWIDIQNVGRSVATQIHGRVGLWLWNAKGGTETDDLIPFIEKTCKENSPLMNVAAATLFPDDKTTFAYGISNSIAPEQIRTAGNSSFIAPVVVGCIDYQFGTSGAHHATQFAFVVTGLDRKRLMPLGVSLRGDQILLERDPWKDRAY